MTNDRSDDTSYATAALRSIRSLCHTIDAGFQRWKVKSGRLVGVMTRMLSLSILEKGKFALPDTRRPPEELPFIRRLLLQ